MCAGRQLADELVTLRARQQISEPDKSCLEWWEGGQRLVPAKHTQTSVRKIFDTRTILFQYGITA